METGKQYLCHTIHPKHHKCHTNSKGLLRIHVNLKKNKQKGHV